MSVTKPRLKKTVLAAVALVVLGAGTAAAVLARSGRDVTTTSAEAYELYQKGLEDERRMYHKDALASYAKALELDPHFTMATLRLAGNIAGRDRERARSLVQCASRNPGNLNEREKLFLAVFEAELLGKDMKKSGELIREYVRRFPDDPEGYFRLAGVLMREGKTEEMLATYERLLSLDPNQAIAYNSLGYHFIGRRDFVKGEDYLKRYRFLAPDQANPYDSLGELYANTGRYDEAEEHLKRALQIRPDFFPAVGHLGTLEVGRGNAEAAVGYFRRAAEMSESWKDKLSFVGAAAMALLDAGRPDDALAMLDEAAAAPPALSPKEDFYFRYHVIRSRAVVLALAGRAAEAEAELALLPAVPDDLEAKEKDEPREGPSRTAGGHRGRPGRPRGGRPPRFGSSWPMRRSATPASFPYYPGTFRVRVRLADALVTLGRPDEAREELRPVLAVNPRFAPALAVIARIEGRGPATPRGPPGADMAVRDARASESFDLRKKVLRLETLYDVSRALNVLREEQALVDEIVARTVSLLDAERGFGVVFEEHGSPSVVATVGFPSFPGALAAASDPFVLDLCRARGPALADGRDGPGDRGGNRRRGGARREGPGPRRRRRARPGGPRGARRRLRRGGPALPRVGRRARGAGPRRAPAAPRARGRRRPPPRGEPRAEGVSRHRRPPRRGVGGDAARQGARRAGRRVAGRRPGAGRERHRQGARRQAPPLRLAAPRRPVPGARTARPFPRPSSRPSSSASSGAWRRASRPASGSSSWRPAGRSSSTRSPMPRSRSRPSSSGSSRSARSSGSAEGGASPSTSGSSPRRTSTSRRRSASGASGRTSTTGSASSRSRSRPCGIGARISRASSGTSSRGSLRARGGRPKALTREAVARLLDYPFPGNVRELENLLEGAAALVPGDTIEAGDLQLGTSRPPEGSNGSLDLATLEIQHIRRVLESVGGNKSEAARILGINRRTLYRKNVAN